MGWMNLQTVHQGARVTLLLTLAQACTAYRHTHVDKVLVAEADGVRAEVALIGIDHFAVEYGTSDDSSLAVQILLRNQSDQPLRLRPEDAVVEIRLDAHTANPDRVLRPHVWAQGNLPRNSRGEPKRDLPAIAPGGTLTLWIAFRGFTEERAQRPYDVRLALPLVDHPSPLQLVLAAPGHKGPLWVLDNKVPSGTSSPLTMGFALSQPPGAGEALQINVVGLASASDRLAFESQTSLNFASHPSRGNIVGLGLSGHVTMPFTWHAAGRSLSVGPSLGLEAGYWDGFRQHNGLSVEQESRWVGGPVLGLTLFADRHRPPTSQFPLVAARRVFGNQLAFRIGYVRWFGTLAEDGNEAPRWGQGGWVAQMRWGILP